MKDRKTRNLIVCSLIVALMAITVVYAVLQTTLNINGAVTKKGGSWDIHFANLSSPTLVGDASVESAKLEGTTFNFKATIVKPGDSLVYTFDVVNSGSIDAVLNSITLNGVKSAKEKDVTYTLSYADGSTISQGDTLSSGQIRTLRLMVSYDDVDSILESDVILNLGAILIYGQADEQQGTTSNDGQMLKNVSLTELYNSGKIVVDHFEGLKDNSISSVMTDTELGTEKPNRMIITLNSNAKISGTMKNSTSNDDRITVTFVDGSVHEIKYGEYEEPHTGGATFGDINIYKGFFYYKNGYSDAYSYISDKYSIQGEIATVEVTTGLSIVEFTEILIEQ